jgi:hypothetical protein
VQLPGPEHPTPVDAKPTPDEGRKQTQKPEKKNVPKKKVASKDSTTENITNAPGGIVNNGGTITSPIVNNFPPSHPQDPNDGKPDLKVAEDAIGMANRFFNSVQPCNEGLAHADQQDTDAKNSSRAMHKFYVSNSKHDIQKYSKDIRDLQTSLIYRLGPAERDADTDEILDRLLQNHIPGDPYWYYFMCSDYQQVGNYFYRLGNSLKTKANAH